MQEWQLSPVQAGTLGSCALFGMLFGGTLLAPLADRFGRRRLVIATTLLASLAAFLTGHARDPLEPVSYTHLRATTTCRSPR